MEVKLSTGVDKVYAPLIGLYPNPASDMLHIKVPVEVSEANVAVVSVTGQQVSATPVQNQGNEITLSVSHLPAGAYMIRLTHANGAIIGIGKFVKK